MHTTKDKQLITFHLDDGKTVQYNLSTGQTIGKRGKPVQSLNSQLKGYSIKEIVEVEKKLGIVCIVTDWDE